MNDEKFRTGRRRFIQGAVTGLVGAAGLKAQQPTRAELRATMPTRAELRATMMSNVEDDIKRDLEMRGRATEELSKPAKLREGAMLDARFSVYYKTAVPEAMRLVTEYFAAYNDRDLNAVARTLHFPYATYEHTEPLVYKTAADFVRNPPPSIFESDKPESQLRPGSYDILDNLQLQTFNPVNVGLELSCSRYRADGYRIGINQGIYAVTNNDGKWGIQLSSVIFTPAEYIGDKFDDALEAHLRRGRTEMAAFGDHEYDLLQGLGWGAGQGNRRTAPKTASITGGPGATTFFLSGWANKPMEPYNSKGRKSRLSVAGVPDAAEINALAASADPIAQYERGLNKTNIVTASGQPGWFFAMAGGEVGHYGYTKALPDAKILHAGPEKAHTLGGYIRYTSDHVFISETRSLGVMILDKRNGVWVTAADSASPCAATVRTTRGSNSRTGPSRYRISSTRSNRHMCDQDHYEDDLKEFEARGLVTRKQFGVMLGAGIAMMLPKVANAVTVVESDVSIKTPDGTADSYFVHPATGTAPGVLVWPDIFGLRPAFRQMGKRLAESGYSVLVVNPFYRQMKAPTAAQGAATPMAQVVPQMNALNETTHLTDAKAFTAWLDQQSSVAKNRKLGSQGYCMGGPMALRTAFANPDRVGAVATFHGAALVAKGDNSPHLEAAKTKAQFLICIATNDDQRAPTDKDEIKKAFDGAHLQAEVEVYKGAHGWCPPDTAVYNEAEAERAWSRLLVLYGKALA